ncbi:MAG: glutamate--tRNA ligase family protein, partial [Spirochaetales bacterium]|nr:glutamate--tRNA ligase family protein [Spirochaetales bacterium]
DLPPDPILLKSDGFPTYHLANVVDDHAMAITHVLRAQEWVPSTPLHLLIYAAFGWEPPRFAHLPMVMGKDGSKLSMRHGSTSVIDFRAAGYLAEATTNYVSMLGWSYDDSREFFSREELEELFSIEKINKAPAVFDYKKLDWYNGQYIRRYDEERLIALLVPYVRKAGWIDEAHAAAGRERLRSLLPLIRERLKVLSDVVPLLRFVYEDVREWPIDELIPKKATAAEALKWLDAAWAVLDGRALPEGGDEAGEEALNDAFRAAAEREGTKLGNLMMTLRVAVTGSKVSPPLIGSIRELGVETTARRVAGARAVLEAAAEGA